MNKLFRLLRYDWPVHFLLLLTNWLPDNVVFLRLRGALIRPFLGKCGKDLRLGRNLVFYNPVNITIGEHVYLAFGCILLANGTITIEDEVMFAPYVVISAANHTSLNGSYRYGLLEQSPIKIGKGTWISSHVVVTAGSKVGNNTVIGAGAVVTKEIPPNVIAGGIPAKVIRDVIIENQ